MTPQTVPGHKKLLDAVIWVAWWCNGFGLWPPNETVEDLNSRPTGWFCIWDAFPFIIVRAVEDTVCQCVSFPTVFQTPHDGSILLCLCNCLFCEGWSLKLAVLGFVKCKTALLVTMHEPVILNWWSLSFFSLYCSCNPNLFKSFQIHLIKQKNSGLTNKWLNRVN